MSDGTTLLPLSLASLGIIASLIAWARERPSALWPLTAACSLVMALVTSFTAGPHHGRLLPMSAMVLAGMLAVAGGGPVTKAVFDLVDKDTGDQTSKAGAILRGGAWIGGLERLAAFAVIAAGWPSGLGLIVGLKGLGRYPELRNHNDTSVAERFLIGTFTSLLWASGCALLGRVLQS